MQLFFYIHINLPYTKRFEFLGINSLELRRLRYDYLVLLI